MAGYDANSQSEADVTEPAASLRALSESTFALSQSPLLWMVAEARLLVSEARSPSSETVREEGANFPQRPDLCVLSGADDPACASGRNPVERTGGHGAGCAATPIFEGQERHEADTAAGVFPGAVNLVQEVWFDGPRLSVPAEEAHARLAALGIGRALPIVNFCNTGQWAATKWFVLSEIAGLNDGTLYRESWVGWTRARADVAAAD